MAHQTPIARWVLNNRERLNPSFVKYDWPERYFRGITDFASSFTVDGIEAVGRGIDHDQNLALEKSAAEAVERYICKALNIDSIGVAVSGESGAREHAEREALERYFFNEHQRLQKPFLKITADSFEFPFICDILEEFETYNSGVAQLSFFKMAAPSPCHAYVTIIGKQGTAQFLGLSLHRETKRAIPRAFFEAMANFAKFRDEPNAFEKDRVASPDAWNSDPVFLATLAPLFNSKTAEAAPIPTPSLLSVPLNVSHLTALKGCPITPVKVVVQRGALQ